MINLKWKSLKELMQRTPTKIRFRVGKLRIKYIGFKLIIRNYKSNNTVVKTVPIAFLRFYFITTNLQSGSNNLQAIEITYELGMTRFHGELPTRSLCSCEFFKFNLAYSLKHHHSLILNKPLLGIAQESMARIKNPSNIPYLCKHLFLDYSFLLKTDYKKLINPRFNLHRITERQLMISLKIKGI